MKGKDASEAAIRPLRSSLRRRTKADLREIENEAADEIAGENSGDRRNFNKSDDFHALDRRRPDARRNLPSSFRSEISERP